MLNNTIWKSDNPRLDSDAPETRITASDYSVSPNLGTVSETEIKREYILPMCLVQYTCIPYLTSSVPYLILETAPYHQQTPRHLLQLPKMQHLKHMSCTRPRVRPFSYAFKVCRAIDNEAVKVTTNSRSSSMSSPGIFRH